MRSMWFHFAIGLACLLGTMRPLVGDERFTIAQNVSTNFAAKNLFDAPEESYDSLIREEPYPQRTGHTLPNPGQRHRMTRPTSRPSFPDAFVPTPHSGLSTIRTEPIPRATMPSSTSSDASQGAKPGNHSSSPRRFPLQSENARPSILAPKLAPQAPRVDQRTDLGASNGAMTPQKYESRERELPFPNVSRDLLGAEQPKASVLEAEQLEQPIGEPYSTKYASETDEVGPRSIAPRATPSQRSSFSSSSSESDLEGDQEGDQEGELEDKLGPIPALPDFSQTPLGAAEVQRVDRNESWTQQHGGGGPQVAMSMAGVSSGLNQSGLDSMVDSYVGQLLYGGGLVGDAALGMGPSLGPGPSMGLAPEFGTTVIPPCSTNCPTGWYGSVAALVMRPTSLGNRAVALYDSGATALATGDLDSGWAAGVDGRIGFYSGSSAVEFNAWGLFESSAQAEVNATGLTPALGLADIGVPFGPARSNRLDYNLQVRSLGFRHVRLVPRSPSVQLGLSVGARYLRIREEIGFAADLVADFALDDASYRLDVENRLFGPNVGGIVRWQINPRLAARVEGEAGVYYNYVETNQVARNALGVATFAAGPNAGQAFDYGLDDSTASVVGEALFNLEYQMTNRLSVVGGYRLMGVSNVARAVNQLPSGTLGKIGDQEVSRRGTMVLHGAQLGIQFNF